MKFENINENTIKISLTFEDLSEHDVKLSDFFQNQEVIEQLFYELVDELGLENRFNQTGMLTFQVQPNPKGVHLIVSEELLGDDNGEIPDDPEEFEEMMNGFCNKLNEIGANMAAERGVKDFQPGLNMDGYTKGKKRSKEADFVFYTLHFTNPMDVLEAVKNVRFSEDLSELYQYDNDFYLVVLDSIKKRGSMQVESMRARLLEFSNLSTYGREFLQEYGKCLIAEHALAKLRKI